VIDRRFVVVGVDGSQASVEALRWAAAYAHSIQGEVRAVIAFDVPWTIYITPTSTDEYYMERAEVMLAESITRAFPEQAPVPISSTVLQARPGLALIGAARGADLLVVGATGHSNLPGMHIGSVAGFCVHHAPCPVLVWRSGPNE
jgi:nucleotide-binding universal stress UspA family protein